MQPPQLAARDPQVAELLAALRQQSQESQAREDRLSRVMEEERRAAAQREAQFVAELDGLRAAVADLAARLDRRADPATAPSSAGLAAFRSLWQRGSAR